MVQTVMVPARGLYRSLPLRPSLPNHQPLPFAGELLQPTDSPQPLIQLRRLAPKAIHRKATPHPAGDDGFDPKGFPP